MSDTPQKAKLILEGSTIDCLFNPQSFAVSKTNVWTAKPTTGNDLPEATWGGGLPRETKLQLLLDSTLKGPGQSIKEDCNKLLKMMESGGGGGGGGGQPPKISFKWGGVELPKSFPLKLTITYVLFHPNGDPKRAFVDLELIQAEKDTTASSSGAGQGQNPTTRAMRGVRVHRVKDGDSLPSIAYGAYGDATKWRIVAEANDIDNPMRLRRGTELAIPTLET